MLKNLFPFYWQLLLFRYTHTHARHFLYVLYVSNIQDFFVKKSNDFQAATATSYVRICHLTSPLALFHSRRVNRFKYSMNVSLVRVFFLSQMNTFNFNFSIFFSLSLSRLHLIVSLLQQRIALNVECNLCGWIILCFYDLYGLHNVNERIKWLVHLAAFFSAVEISEH